MTTSVIEIVSERSHYCISLWLKVAPYAWDSYHFNSRIISEIVKVSYHAWCILVTSYNIVVCLHIRHELWTFFQHSILDQETKSHIEDDEFILAIFKYLMIKGIYIHANIWSQKKKIARSTYSYYLDNGNVLLDATYWFHISDRIRTMLLL